MAILQIASNGEAVELIQIGYGEPPKRRVPKYLGPDLVTVLAEAKERAERRRLEAFVRDAEAMAARREEVHRIRYPYWSGGSHPDPGHR